MTVKAYTRQKSITTILIMEKNLTKILLGTRVRPLQISLNFPNTLLTVMKSVTRRKIIPSVPSALPITA